MVALTVENLQGLDRSTSRGRAYARFKKLEHDRTSWRSHWMEISDYVAPRRGRFLIDNQQGRGRKRNNKIIDSTGTDALRTMSAGLMSGMTNPARPWFRFAPVDDELLDDHEVKAYTDRAEKVVASILHRSNFYNTVYTVYTELGAFGTSPLYRQKNYDSVIRFRPFTAGEYVIAEDDQGVINTLGREFTMTVSQIVTKFVVDQDGKADWSIVSRAVKALWDKHAYDELVTVVQMIAPRAQSARSGNRLDGRSKRFSSVYLETGADGDRLLQEGGYSSFPAYVPRWDVLSGDVYGRCPGMDKLPDIKQLQHEQKRKAQAIDKMVRPPMTAPTSMRGKAASTNPASITYLDPSQAGQKFEPAYMVNPRIAELTQDIAEVQERIQRGFYADLFAMMINSDRRNITATEVAERHSEKLVLLGPVLQRVNVELLDPLLDDVFSFAQEAGLLPDPPRALQDKDLKVKYVSLLAQAQQAVAASSIERTMSFAGNMSAVFPEIVDGIDADEAMRQYSDILGTSPKIIRGQAEVDATRQGRAEAAAAAQQQEQAGIMAQNAKVLSETDTQNPNALTDLIGGETI